MQNNSLSSLLRLLMKLLYKNVTAVFSLQELNLVHSLAFIQQSVMTSTDY